MIVFKSALTISGMRKLVQYKWLAVMLVIMLTACQTPPVKEQDPGTIDGTAEGAASNPEAEVKIVRVEPVRPKIDLTEELLYKILVAEVAGQRGALDISVENYLELALETRDPKIVERATRIAVYARDTEAAWESAKLWVELDPRNPDPHQILAVMSLREGQVEETLDHLEQILKYTAGEFRQKLWMIVNMLGRERNRDIVMEVMEKLLLEHKDEADAVYAFADIAARMGQLDRSMELLETAMQMSPDNDDIALSYVSTLQRMNRTNDAIAWLEEELNRRGENDFNLRLAYARLLYREQRFDAARRQFEILVVAAPNNPDVLYLLGNLYLQANRLDDAELYFTRLVDLDNRYNNAKYLLGWISEERKDFDKASIWYLSVTEGDYSFDAQIRYGLLQAKQKSTQEALEHLESISTTNIKQENIKVEAVAELLTKEERYAEAMSVYDNVLNKRYDASLLYSRAMLAEKMDLLDLLEEDLRLIISREPDHVDALNALGYTLADRTDRYQEAYEFVQKALSLNPDNYYIMDSMGWVLYRLGRHQESIDYLRKALEQRHDPEIAAHLGEVLWVAGDKEGARKVWETALKDTPDDTKLIDVMKRFTPVDSTRH